MAEANKSLNVLVIGGAEDAGLAITRALLKRGHKVVATARNSQGALAIRQAGALPVYPALSRASEILSTLKLAQADAIVYAGPQVCGGAPQADVDYEVNSAQLTQVTKAVVQAAASHGVKRIVSLSFGYLYEASHGAAKEGDQDVSDKVYAPMLSAEATVQDSGLSGFIVRSAYTYGGHNPTTNMLADAIKSSKRLPAGEKPASWIHEDDLAAAMVALVETDEKLSGIEIINAADDRPCSPNEFVAATCDALGLSHAAFAGAGMFAMLRQKTLRDKLLEREIIISSAALRDRFGWQPRHNSIDSGLDATALVWRMRDAIEPDDFYNLYDDKAAEAIAAFVYEVALPEPAAVTDRANAAEAVSAPQASPPSAAAPPSSDGPTPWNEDDAKREERRRKALERRAKRAAKQAGG